jgi:hypothetical protein
MADLATKCIRGGMKCNHLVCMQLHNIVEEPDVVHDFGSLSTYDTLAGIKMYENVKGRRKMSINEGASC